MSEISNQAKLSLLCPECDQPFETTAMIAESTEVECPCCCARLRIDLDVTVRR